MSRQILDATLKDVVAPIFKEHRFRRTRRSWAYRDENTAIANFQTRASLEEEATEFTVNLGVWSPHFASLQDFDVDDAKFDVWSCHLQRRLGQLLPDRPPMDYWWLLDDATDDELLRTNFAHYMTSIVLPYLVPLATERGLRDHLLAAHTIQRLWDQELRLLIELVAKLGPAELLPALKDAEAATEPGLDALSLKELVEEAVVDIQSNPAAEPLEYPRIIRTPPG